MRAFARARRSLVGCASASARQLASSRAGTSDVDVVALTAAHPTARRPSGVRRVDPSVSAKAADRSDVVSCVEALTPC